MDERELVHQVLGHGDTSPVLAPAFERGDPQLRGLEVDVARSKRQGLAGLGFVGAGPRTPRPENGEYPAQ